MNTCWSTVHWGMGGGRGVSVGGVSQLRPLNVNHCPLLSPAPERDKVRGHVKSHVTYSIPTSEFWSEIPESKLVNTTEGGCQKERYCDN